MANEECSKNTNFVTAIRSNRISKENDYVSADVNTTSFVEQRNKPNSVQQPTFGEEPTDENTNNERISFSVDKPSSVVTADLNWQSSCSSLRQRNEAMLYNELMSDVRFNVSANGVNERIPAHRYILATGSSVFYAMFYGGLSYTEEIDVPDVEPIAFRVLLKYLYCDDIQLETDNVLCTLYAAKKYIVPHLARACVSFLESSLTAGNACLLLSQSRLFEETELMQRCWEVIDAQASVALSSDGFTEVDHSTLCTILSRETLNCPELEVFEAAANWARHECARKQLDNTEPQQWRKVLGEALYMVRVVCMEMSQFADNIAQSGVLTLQEITDIFLHFTAKQKPSLMFAVKPRLGLKSQICHRFLSSAYRENQWRYRGRCDSVQFSVDRRVFIVGFGLYGSSNGAAEYSVYMALKRHDMCLAENTTSFFSDGCSNTFHVYFRHPIQVEPETFYTASTVLDGVELSYFGQEGMSEVVCGAVTFQFQCSSDSTNGTGVQGGQIPELIFYGPHKNE